MWDSRRITISYKKSNGYNMKKKTIVKSFGDIGYIKSGNVVCTYQLGEESSDGAIDLNDVRYPANFITPMKMAQFSVYPNGYTNLEPNIIKEMVQANRLLPELLNKKMKMLYGAGPMLFRFKKEGKDAWREFFDDKRVTAWLESWQRNGLQDDYKIYLMKTIISLYYDGGAFSKIRLTQGAEAGLSEGYRVAGLEHISTTRARLATIKDLSQRTDFVASDFELVIVANWLNLSYQDYLVYPKFDYANPLKFPATISYSKTYIHGEEIYAHNLWFKGIERWVRGSNLTPAYINDYLMNALSARTHVIIPQSWMRQKQNDLETLCRTNAERKVNGQPLQSVYVGNKSLDVGTEFNKNILRQYVALEMERLAECLTGEGKNQGKIYVSESEIIDGEEVRWKIESIDQKYKEYIEALTSYDKRADEVMLSSIGLDPSISNITKDGIISKSGADAYYNYLIYLSQLTLPEEIVCKDINIALQLNFPELYDSGARIGFYRSAVAKQQDVPEQDRMKNQQNQ